MVFDVADDIRAALRRSSSTSLPFSLPESYLQVRDTTIEPIWGWTMERMIDGLMAHAQGDVAAGQEVKLAMMRDPIIAADVETRCETLVQMPLWWERPPELPEWAFSAWTDRWPRCLAASDREEVAEDRLMLGVTPTNSTWAPDRTGRLWMPTLNLKEPGNLVYMPEEKRYHFMGRDKEWTVTSDGQRWLLFQRKSKTPHLSGLILPLGVVWMTEAEALRGLASRARSLARPWRLLMVPADQRESDDVKALVRRTQEQLSGGVLTMPQYKKELPSFDFKLISDDGGPAVAATFENLIKLCWVYKHLLILGASEQVAGTSASNAKAMTHERTFLRKVRRDAKSDVESYTELGRCFARVNRLPEAAAPIPVIDADIPEDENQLAERQKNRAAAGKDIGTLIGVLKEEEADYEPDYLLEQVGLFLKRKQGAADQRGTY